MNKLIRLAILAFIAIVVALKYGKGSSPGGINFGDTPPAPEFVQRKFGPESVNTMEQYSAPDQQVAQTREPPTTSNQAHTIKSLKKKLSETAPIFLHWDHPKQANNKADSSIEGYVIVFVNRQSLSDETAAFGSIDFNALDFKNANYQFNQLIAADRLALLAKKQITQMLVVNAGNQRSLSLYYFPRGEYFFAISAFNSNGDFAELSQTISIDTH